MTTICYVSQPTYTCSTHLSTQKEQQQTFQQLCKAKKKDLLFFRHIFEKTNVSGGGGMFLHQIKKKIKLMKGKIKFDKIMGLIL